MLKIIISRFWNVKIMGRSVTEKGRLLCKYLREVILDNKEPTSMMEQTLERHFNPEGLTGKARIARAAAVYIELSKYLPF